MKALDLLENMGDIQEKYILEANELDKMKLKKVGRKTARLTYLAAVLAVCLLAATAYAVISYSGISDMKKDTLQPLPQEAEPYIQQQEVTGEAQDWSCQVVETLFDANHFMVAVGVSGGDKYIVVPTDAMAEDSVGLIGISGQETLGEYAAKQGKKLLFVGAGLNDRDKLGIAVASQDFRNQSDSEMTILVEGQYSSPEPISEASCQVYALEEGKYEMDDVQRVNLSFTVNQAPSENERVFKPDNPDAIPGMTVGDATITETPLGISVQIPETVTDQQAYYDIMKVDFDEITYGEGGSLLMSDGSYTFQVSMCQGTVTDTLTVHYYDWDKNPLGTIVFHAE